VHGVHTAAARAAFELGTKLVQLFLATRDHDLDFATVGVANPTLQSPSPCLAVNKPTEADPLHTSLDDVMAHHMFALPLMLETGMRLRPYRRESFPLR
jgi:hypothetical protein